MRSTHPIARTITTACVVVAGLVLPAQLAAADNGREGQGTIASAGPLTSIRTSPDLNCAVNYSNDSAGEFYGDTACGTFLAVNGTLYGPAAIPAGGRASPRVPFTPISQTKTGSGTISAPYTVTTTVRAGLSYTIIQTDQYVVGQSFFSTTVNVTSSAAPLQQSAILYRAADCYLGDSDFGQGQLGQRWVACTSPSGRVEEWIDVSGESQKAESFYGDIWSRIGARTPFDNTCDCNASVDNGAGLSWNISIGAAHPVTVSHQISFIAAGGPELAGNKYVALGDSYSSGEGLGPYLADATGDSCHRSLSAYPNLLPGLGSSQLAQPSFVACTGAVTHDLISPSRLHPGEPAQTDVSILTQDTKYVTLTVGGDDLGFAQVLGECVTKPAPFSSGKCADSSAGKLVHARLLALSGSGNATEPNGLDIQSWLKLLQTIHERAPQARILVGGYPDLIDPYGSQFGTDGNCLVGYALAASSATQITIRRANAKWLSDQARALNDALKVAIQNSGVPGAEYVDVESTFTGHLICDDSKVYLNGVLPNFDFTQPTASGSFHPKRIGQIAYSADFESVLG